tara:strand:+ start:221 stop:805 length:585 start_codon:yes stop_codon:yes gene_type:complete
MFEAPVAGANYAADTRNYPWHRPPDLVNYDEGVDYIIKKLQDPEQLETVYALLKIDIQVSTVVTSLFMQAISRGKFSIDLAILMAGPIARYIGIIADEQDIKYDMGVGDEDRIKITPTSLKMALGIIDDDEEPAEVLEEPTVEASGGLMGAPSPDEITTATEGEQASMLGMSSEEEDLPPEDEMNEEETRNGMA